MRIGHRHFGCTGLLFALPPWHDVCFHWAQLWRCDVSRNQRAARQYEVHKRRSAIGHSIRVRGVLSRTERARSRTQFTSAFAGVAVPRLLPSSTRKACPTSTEECRVCWRRSCVQRNGYSSCWASRNWDEFLADRASSIDRASHRLRDNRFR